MRTDKTSVVDIISEMDPWVDEVMLLRDIILKTGLLKEEIFIAAKAKWLCDHIPPALKNKLTSA